MLPIRSKIENIINFFPPKTLKFSTASRSKHLNNKTNKKKLYLKKTNKLIFQKKCKYICTNKKTQKMSLHFKKIEYKPFQIKRNRITQNKVRTQKKIVVPKKKEKMNISKTI